jgi:propanol-preferring alcohol dehydrogenase
MQALILDSPKPVAQNPLRLASCEAPSPGPREIRVQVHACGICHTDLHTVVGDLSLPRLPLIPGHQVVGTVDAVGPGARRFRIGARVGLAWLNSACGMCRFCTRGSENLCEAARFTGYHTDGGYAEQTVAPEDFAYVIPKVFSDPEAAPLLCAGIVGYRALRLSEARPGGRLGLYGFGASAHITLQVARHLGCEVYVFSRGREHLRLAEKLGAVWTGRAEETPPHKLHSAIVFAPAGAIVPEALRVLEKGGTLALAGITMSAIPELNYRNHLYHEKTVRSVTNSTRADGEALLRIAAEIPIRPQTESFPLEEANRALQLLADGRINGAGVLEVRSEGSKDSRVQGSE